MSASIKSGVLTLLHTCCGAGILAMPFAFKPFGLIFGILIITFCGLCAFLGLLLQARVTRYIPQGSNASFFVLANEINPNLSVLFDVAIAIKCFGVGVSYLIVVGDLMPQIFQVFTENSWLLNRDVHITLIMLFIISPLCFMKKLNSLRYASMVAISSVVYLCVLVIVHFIIPSNEITELKGNISYGFPKNEPSPLTTLPIFIFAYTCHHNMFSVINEQTKSGFYSTKFVAIYSIVLAYILYIVIGCSGYLTFGDNITGNIIMLYPNSWSSTIGRIAIVFLVMLAFPLQCHPARASLHHVIHFIEKKFTNEATSVEPNTVTDIVKPNTNNSNIALHTHASATEDDTLLAEELIEENSPNQPEIIPLKGKRFAIITACILIGSYLLAISVHSLAFMLSIVGATGSTSISFILPGIFGYKLIGSEYNDNDEEVMPPKTKMFKILGLCLSIWGLIVMIASLVATLLVGPSH
ncbi:vacuolar amino acid transporter 6 [Monosporozyma servazzii]